MSNAETAGNQKYDLPDEDSIDLRTVDEGRYIFPSPAAEPGINILEIKNLKIPVSLAVKDKRFRLNGVQKETSVGFVISGIYTEELVKINHIIFDEELRRTGMSQAALVHLESEMKKKGVKIVYASFAQPPTVEFFLKNQYEIISHTSLKSEEKKELAITEDSLDLRVNNKADYDRLKSEKGNEFRKILLKHNLENI